MADTITPAAVGAVTRAVLYGVWRGLLMKNFHRDQRTPIVRRRDGGEARGPLAATAAAVVRMAAR